MICKVPLNVVVNRPTPQIILAIQKLSAYDQKMRCGCGTIPDIYIEDSMGGVAAECVECYKERVRVTDEANKKAGVICL